MIYNYVTEVNSHDIISWKICGKRIVKKKRREWMVFGSITNVKECYLHGLSLLLLLCLLNWVVKSYFISFHPMKRITSKSKPAKAKQKLLFKISFVKWKWKGNVSDVENGITCILYAVTKLFLTKVSLLVEIHLRKCIDSR